MAKHRRLRLNCVYTLILLSTVLSLVYSWSPNPTFFEKCKTSITTASIIASQSMIIFLQPLSASASVTAFHKTNFPSTTLAAADSSSPNLKQIQGQFSAMNEESLRKSLRAPTEDYPQIKVVLPDEYKDAKVLPQNPGKSPIVQGLVYLVNKDQRPDLSDYLVLTVGTVSNPEYTLAGAKFSVAKARFPFQFSLFDANILSNRKDEWAQAQNGDYIVTARVCPGDVSKLPCENEESTFRARGISKLLGNLPGMREGDVVRTAVSLPLER